MTNPDISMFAPLSDRERGAAEAVQQRVTHPTARATIPHPSSRFRSPLTSRTGAGCAHRKPRSTRWEPGPTSRRTAPSPSMWSGGRTWTLTDARSYAPPHANPLTDPWSSTEARSMPTRRLLYSPTVSLRPGPGVQALGRTQTGNRSLGVKYCWWQMPTNRVAP